MKIPNCSTTPLVLLAGVVESRTRLWIFRADYIEHHFEARAMLPPISDALCNRLFLFSSTSDNWMTVRMGYDFAMTWAKQRRGETPGQERHSGRTAKAFLTLSLLRAHFYTGVFHTSYVRSARLTDTNSELYLSLRHCVPDKGLHPLRCFTAIPASLRVQNNFSNHSVPTRLKKSYKGGSMEYTPNPELERLKKGKRKEGRAAWPQNPAFGKPYQVLQGRWPQKAYPPSLHCGRNFGKHRTGNQRIGEHRGHGTSGTHLPHGRSKERRQPHDCQAPN